MPFGNARGQGFNTPSIINFQIDNIVFTVAGMFVYSTNPGALGTLKFSLPFGGPSTDKYGNAYLDGVTWYTFSGGVYYASQLFSDTANGPSVRFYSAPAPNGPWTLQGIVQANSNGVLSLGAAVSVDILQPLATFLTMIQPGSGNVTETWHNLALTTVTGSGNGVNGFRYKVLPFSCLLLEWDLNSNTVGNNVTIATLPANWRPAVAHNIESSSYGGSTALTTGGNPHFTVNPSGTIVTGGFPAVAFQVCGTALIGLD